MLKYLVDLNEHPDIEGMQQRVKVLSYEYMLAKFCEWHSDSQEILFSEFNEKNKITYTKSLLYPFFTCIGNGSFRLLYELFGDFYALENGPTSRIAMECLSTDSMSYFQFDLKNRFILQIKRLDDFTNWKSLLESIKTEVIDNEINLTRISVRFDNKQAKSICTAIDKSIENLRQTTNNKFITFDKYELVTLARQHDSWDIIHSYYKKHQDSTLEDYKISSEKADRDRKVYWIEEDEDVIMS